MELLQKICHNFNDKSDAYTEHQLGSGSSWGSPVEVRVFSSAPFYKSRSSRVIYPANFVTGFA